MSFEYTVPSLLHDGKSGFVDASRTEISVVPGSSLFGVIVSSQVGKVPSFLHLDRIYIYILQETES